MSQLTDARTLNESLIDVADQHTILEHIGKKPAIRGKKTRSTSRPAHQKTGAIPLPFETERSYNDLLSRMGGKAIAYSDVRGSEGTMLARLRPAYVRDRFWLHLVPRTDIKLFPALSWGRLLPIQATLLKKVTFVPKPTWPQKFSPVPRVVLYPFGWSTWLSILVSGPHSIHDLADFLEHLFTGACLQVDGAAMPESLDRYMLDVGEGVASDAFGPGVKDVPAPDLAAVTAVLSKTRASPALGALDVDDQAQMLRLIRPGQPPTSHDFDDFVLNLVKPPDGVNYMLRSGRKYFVWFERKLGGDKRSDAQIRCYSNNTFASVVRTRHLQSLLNQASKRPDNPPLDQLVSSAVDELSRLLNPGDDELTSPYYRNVALKDISGTADLANSVSTAKTQLGNRRTS